ncbi:MAG: fibronectin type III domain-containing protein [Acidobacteria bacterium]|nr:fibronectin type III domain-containing protein [Acidobacteriota bacterium]
MRTVPGALALAVLAAVACGHRGPPLPPLPRIPETPRQVEYRQRGDNVQLRAQYHLSATESRPLRPPATPAVLVGAPGPGAEPGALDSPSRAREFQRNARAVLLPAFAPAELGQTVTRRDSLPLAQLGDAQAFVLALALQDRRARSFVSARKLLAPARPPLPALASFDAAPEERGVRLAWRAPDDPRATEVRVYRWRDGETEPWQPWRVVPIDPPGLFDDTASYGETLWYTATAAQAGTTAPVESEPARAAEVAYADRFPPAPSHDLDVVAETGRVRVLWYPGGSADEALTIVERQREGEELFEVAGRVDAPDTFFIDPDVVAGTRYRYRVISVDQQGNRSEPVGPTDWVSPRPAQSEP